MKKIKNGLDSVLMKRTIQEQLSKEMKGMSTAARLAYIKRQVDESPFFNVAKDNNRVKPQKTRNQSL
jgi:hypothetical protein